jgi:hypothetical protein
MRAIIESIFSFKQVSTFFFTSFFFFFKKTVFIPVLLYILSTERHTPCHFDNKLLTSQGIREQTISKKFPKSFQKK